MKNVMIAVGAILMTWAIVMPMLVGAGLLIQRMYGLRKINADTVVGAFWIGFAVTLAVGQVWHLFWAADGRVWLIILPMGVWGLVWCRHALWRWLAQCAKGRVVAIILCTLLLTLAVRVALLGSLPPRLHDTGSYHLPAALWSHAFPVVPGLSNLHARLGFNSSVFVYAATLSEGLWEGRPHHVVMGPMLLITMLLSVTAAIRVYSSRSAHVKDLLAATFVAPVVYLLHTRNYTASLSPNCLITLLVLVGTWQAVVALTSVDRAACRAQYALFCSTVILAAATTVKLTVAPFATAMWLLMAWWSLRCSNSVSGKTLLKPVTWMLLWSLLLIGPWLIRGVILSGYPLYPVLVGGSNVEWRVPEEQAKIEAEWSRSFARLSRHGPAEGLQWVGPWSKDMYKRWVVKLPVLLAAGAALIIVMLLRKEGWPESIHNQRRALWVVWLVVFAIVVWFLTAPDLRYGVGFFWLLSGLLGAVAFALMWQWSARTVKTVVLGVVLVLSLAEASYVVVELPSAARLASSRGTSKTLRDRLDQGLSPLPLVNLRTYITSYGLSLMVPLKGNQVWGAPLLSTPHPSPNLNLRNPEDVSAGFKSEGPWAPYGYPNLKTRYHEYVEQRLSEISAP